MLPFSESAAGKVKLKAVSLNGRGKNTRDSFPLYIDLHPKLYLKSLMADLKRRRGPLGNFIDSKQLSVLKLKYHEPMH